MTRITYAVTVAFQDERLAEDWLVWLTGGHIEEVLAGGASDAELTEADGPGRSFEVRYHFPSREAFAAYERDFAPRLRAEGLKRFPPEKGIVYRRSVGAVLGTWPRDPDA
jgi:hypothetical protein